MPRPKKQASCHPDKIHVALGFCDDCYRRQPHRRRQHRASNIKWRKANTEIVKGYKLQHRYGITKDQWYAMYWQQNGKCPICQNDIYRRFDPSYTANIDHDPITGRVRGLTCGLCNRSRIGNNTLETARRLVAYLENEFDGRSL